MKISSTYMTKLTKFDIIYETCAVLDMADPRDSGSKEILGIRI